MTTINAPTDAIRSVAAAPGWCLIVVGDAITPNDEYEALASGFEGVTYLSLAAQRELPFESIPLTPERHFGRKNIGYLYATWCGAHVIFDFDDDNAPLSAAALDGPEWRAMCYFSPRSTNIILHRACASRFLLGRDISGFGARLPGLPRA